MSEEPTRKEESSAVRTGETARQLIRRAKQASRRKFPAEEKIRILLEGVRGEVSVVELCRREGIHPTIYYKWLKDFMEAGKCRLRGETKREATAEEVRRTGPANSLVHKMWFSSPQDIARSASIIPHPARFIWLFTSL